jgi:hypothetical protein
MVVSLGGDTPAYCIVGFAALSMHPPELAKVELMPCSEKRARLLLDRKRARIHRMRPFTIRLVDRTVEESILQPIRLKIDPGPKVTGIALS